MALSFLNFIYSRLNPNSELMNIYYDIKLKLFRKIGLITCDVKLKQSHGRSIRIRINDSDLECLRYVFISKYHIPPFKITEDPIILDLGSNIGATVLDFSFTYPGSKIFSYEMDRNNFELATRNCKSIKNLTLVNKAIWWENTSIEYFSKDGTSDSFSISNKSETINAHANKVECITISDVLKKNNIDKVDYLKMDIEGAEIEIFKKDLSWLEKVKAMNVEIHDSYEIDIFINILNEYGFKCWKDTKHWSSIFALKD